MEHGGKIAESFNEAATNLGIKVDFYISLSATAPIPGQVPGLTKIIEKGPDGLSKPGLLLKWFLGSIAEQNKLSGHTIIPENIYLNDFFGDLPVNLLGAPVRYRSGVWVNDLQESVNDTGLFKFADFPLVGLVIADSTLEDRHALTDNGVWGFFITMKIYRSYLKNNKVKLSGLAPEKWQKLIQLTRGAPNYLTTTIHGNHYFFIGEQGASKLSENIEILDQRVKKLKDEIGSIIGVKLD